MRITVGDYIIRPYQNGLCWTIDKYDETRKKDGSVEVELKNTGKFPSTLEQAIMLLAEMALKDCDAESDGWEAAVRELEDFKKKLLDQVGIATMKPGKRR